MCGKSRRMRRNFEHSGQGYHKILNATTIGAFHNSRRSQRL